MQFFLGIDTGGTFTDAVLLDARRQVVAAAKSLTTRFDLSVGIGGALDKLPTAMLECVDLVSLSTTLTTNSVVEGKGSPVCVLLAGYDAAQIKASGLADLLGAEAIVSLSSSTQARNCNSCSGLRTPKLAEIANADTRGAWRWIAERDAASSSGVNAAPPASCPPGSDTMASAPSKSARPLALIWAAS